MNVCHNSSVQGDCGQTTCDGDAITCAILQKQRQQYCEDHDEKNPQVILGRQLLAGEDPMKNSYPSIDNAQTVDLSQNRLDSNGWGMGGSCFIDKTFSVMGFSIIIPFSQTCPYLIALRYAIMLLASIASYRTVSGSILRS
ncbi:hypothetical protein [Undibacterium sp.]|uniref:hypothetical protein n=1 Tax=Undibacterium sp. TaxID=1914977 RepID=UPI002CC318DC|nr:hypothetical protein [Undibacterium sp.]HTD06238.1 hypothetical protein [Undibacterium sp.]